MSIVAIGPGITHFQLYFNLAGILSKIALPPDRQQQAELIQGEGQVKIIL
jgi:hypothetical protein